MIIGLVQRPDQDPVLDKFFVLSIFKSFMGDTILVILFGLYLSVDSDPMKTILYHFWLCVLFSEDQSLYATALLF